MYTWLLPALGAPLAVDRRGPLWHNARASNHRLGAWGMNTFDDRKKAAEAKFKHDQEFQFKVIARRNKLLGLWAAEKMGIAGDDADAYAKQVVMADFEEPGDDDVVRKVMGDLGKAEIEMTEHRLRKKMDELMAEAKQQVMSE